MTAWEEKKVLVTVKTYPTLSKKYDRLVCTAGITEDGEWIRLYPVPWWDLEDDKKFKKFDWIEAKVKPAKEKLNRKESHKVKEGSIEIVDGLPVQRKHAEKLYDITGKEKFDNFSEADKQKNWEKRTRWVDDASFNSVEKLRERKEENFSLGAVKPENVKDFYWEKGDNARHWEEDLVEGTQQTLGQNDYETPLDHISRVFKYNFTCRDSSCKDHNMMAEDWELLQAWRKWQENYDGKEETFEKIKDRFYTKMFKDGESYFFLGTESEYDKYLIIGLFYPPSEVVDKVRNQAGFDQFT